MKTITVLHEALHGTFEKEIAVENVLQIKTRVRLGDSVCGSCVWVKEDGETHIYETSQTTSEILETIKQAH